MVSESRDIFLEGLSPHKSIIRALVVVAFIFTQLGNLLPGSHAWLLVDLGLYYLWTGKPRSMVQLITLQLTFSGWLSHSHFITQSWKGWPITCIVCSSARSNSLSRFQIAEIMVGCEYPEPLRWLTPTPDILLFVTSCSSELEQVA